MASDQKANPLLQAALAYAEKGWPVFPIWWAKGRCACVQADCQHPGKHPIGKLAPKGRNSATTDPVIIKKWWRQYPQANIGLPTGPETFVVVDVDPRNGGNSSLEKLQRLGQFPETPQALTGGGGLHIFLKHPGNGQKIKSKAELGGFPGIDQKADGGYIVAPPSTHFSGGKYSWKIGPDTPLAEIPEWLWPLLMGKNPSRPEAPSTSGDHAAYAQAALAGELAELAGTAQGNRNARLNQAAFALGQLVGAGALDRAAVVAALEGTAAAIGLGEAEARATIRSGLDAGEKSPREVPEKAGRRESTSGQMKPSGASGKSQQTADGELEAERIWWVGHCYMVERGRLCLEVIDREGRPDSRVLANFTAHVEEEVSRDDGGAKPTKEYRITGSLDTGRALPPAVVAAKEFDSLKWISREWGAAAAVAPGRSLGPHLGNAILAHSQGFKRRTVYAHSGWRQIGGVWRYFHGGGAIGQGEPIETDLGENLQLYRLPAPGGLEAVQASLRFLDLAPLEITAPLFAAAYLAPFADILKVDFSLWLYGPTGSKKSTLAALALCHFGKFTRLTLPGSWFSTANALERLCYTLKDSLIIIDDFMPGSSQKESHAMGERAARIIYQAGNRSGRGRLAPDLSARPNYYPRGLILSTGEVLLPGQRQSATARYLGIELDPKTPIHKEKLTAAQADAAAGLYAAAMSAYLEDQAPRLDELQEEMRALFEAYRTAFTNGGHARIPEIQSWLAVAIEFALRHFVRLGAVTGGQADALLKQAWKVFKVLGERHSRVIEGEKTSVKFLSVLRELFLTSRVYAEDKARKGPPPHREDLGWGNFEPAGNAYPVAFADDEMLYLLADSALRAVSQALREAGDFLGLGRNELWAALAREGIIVPGPEGRTTRSVRIQGGVRRVICLPLEKLIPNEAEDEGM